MSTTTHSQTWFDTFLRSIDPAHTRREAAFLARQLPRATVENVLDICCGPGRHAFELTALGYRVTGIDVDAREIDFARSAAGNSGETTFLVHDMRRIDEIPGTFDAAVILWQSFGLFDAATNADILRQIAKKLPAGGRMILDIYHREFFASRLDPRTHERDGRSIVETKRMNGDRLTIHLDYGDGRSDTFDWQVFTPDQITTLAARCGFKLLLGCTNFDESQPPTSQQPRVQYMFET